MSTQYTINATITPSDATNKAVTWTTSDESVATVSNTGEIVGVGVGSATITVTTSDIETAMRRILEEIIKVINNLIYLVKFFIFSKFS